MGRSSKTTSVGSSGLLCSNGSLADHPHTSWPPGSRRTRRGTYCPCPLVNSVNNASRACPGTTVNYVDRLVMGILAPDLQRMYHISDVQYGYIQSAFALSYAFGQLIAGGWLDRVGTRIGYAVALAAWSVSSILHAFARGPLGF